MGVGTLVAVALEGHQEPALLGSIAERRKDPDF